jgi:hypothetical protein
MRATIACRIGKNTCAVQNMQEEAKLVKKGFQLFQIIDRNIRPTIPKEPPWLPKVTTRDHLIYQKLQTVDLQKENASINSFSLPPYYIHKFMYICLAKELYRDRSMEETLPYQLCDHLQGNVIRSYAVSAKIY